MGVCKVIYKDNPLIDLTQDTVTAQDLRQGVTAHNSNGDLVTGSMQNQGTLNEEISQVNQVVEIPEGYHSGYGSVEIAGSEQAKLIPENIREGVNILGVNGSHAGGVDLSNDTITADKLLAGATAHNSAGEQITGSMTDNSGTSGTIETASGAFTIPQGYHDGSGSVAISQAEQAKIIPENIKAGVNILGVIGSASGEGGGTDTSDATANASDILAGQTAYVDGEKVTGTMINRGGVTGSMSFANDVFSIAQGYHDGTGSVTIDSAEQAKIIPENIKSGVTILGATGSYQGEGGGGVDTSSDTVTASDLLSGVTAHDALGNAIIGTIANRGNFSATITSKNQVVIIPQGYHDGTGTVQISESEKEKIISENINNKIELLGVVGSCENFTMTEVTSERLGFTNFSISAQSSNDDHTAQVIFDANDTSNYLDEYYVYFGTIYYIVFRKWGRQGKVAFSTVSTAGRTESITNCLRPAPDGNDSFFFVPYTDGYLILSHGETKNLTSRTSVRSIYLGWG